MPLPNLAVPAFPDLPPVPGVPPIARNAAAQAVAAINGQIANINATINNTTGLIEGVTSAIFAPILSQDGPDVQSSAPAPQWGIFDQAGNSVLLGDTVFEMDYIRELKVADYPIENGGFASYNKVATPFAARVTFLKGGSIADKTTFLDDVENALDSLYLYWLVTPEVTYKNVNLTRNGYSRAAAKGVGLMRVEIEVQEIRVAPDPVFTKTQSPSAQATANGGTVQAAPPTKAQSQATAGGST